MAKRVKQISNCVQDKLGIGIGREHHHSMDRISELPDEILASIVSLLTLREALSTTILSKRWLSIWTFASSGSLNFDASMAKWRHGRNPEAKISKYVEWVNKVLELRKSFTLDEFIVCFRSDASYGRVIDKWFDFAIEKRVQIFELDLTTYSLCNVKAPEKYCFSQECYAHIQSPHGVSNIKPLKSISLKCVNIRGEILEFLLSSCPLLERICVKQSEHLVKLKVSGSSLQLKYLDVKFCENLKSMEISAPKLESFIYVGQKFNLHIEDAPLLVNVSISDQFRASLTYVYGALESYLSQLQTLKLEFNMNELNMQLPQCEFTSLRHLILSVRARDGDSLLKVSSIIKASPLLQRFTFQLHFGGTFRRKKIRRAPKCPHQHLKIIELDGFVGHPIDLELAIYLLENAVVLEKIMITTTSTRATRRMRPSELAKEAARQLETKVPRGAELIIV